MGFGSSSPLRSPRHLRRQRLRRPGLRRHCSPHCPLISLLYLSALFLCCCPLSLFLRHPPLPGSVYRSHHLFALLRHSISNDTSTPIQLSKIWKYKKLAKPRCRPSSHTNGTTEGHGLSSGYLIVEANGGLNQQRSSICNAVAIAGLLNATLVIPQFHYHRVWRDPSEFGDIYDVDHFISTLTGFVNVVRELPLSSLNRFNFNISHVPTIHVQAWAPINYYLETVYPLLQNKGVIRIAPFANRLAMNVPLRIQSLRCLANYKALRFAPPISVLAKELVKRMLRNSAISDGKYLAMHLRFEEDMVAFSCCAYDGGVEERVLMNMVRENGWGSKFRQMSHVIDPGLNRMTGKCPLTPVEVGMMLRAMGFNNKTTIYLAAGKLYKAEKHLAPFLEMFPLVYTKESLATPEELGPFQGYSSRLAALDYVVCLFSEVFVMTQGGNFPHFLTGHRKFIYGGHSKTIKPNKMKLVRLFHDTLTSWDQIKFAMKQMLFESNQEGMAALHIRKSRRKASVYQFPYPDCGCLLQNAQNITLRLANMEATLDGGRLLSVIM